LVGVGWLVVICIYTGCEPSQCEAALLMVSYSHVIKRTNRWHPLPSAAPRVSPAGWWLLDCQRTLLHIRQYYT